MKEIYKIDLNRDKSRENAYLSETLLTKIEATLEKGEKILLYLNKRGTFSSYVCKDCGHIYTCPNCDLSLNIHSNPDRCVCHHCFYSEALSDTCSECGSVDLQRVGVGTAQIESSIKKLFPDINIYRFDTDTLSTINAKKEALSMMDNADLIVGTKMITTGFNIKKVGLIGVILIEQELNIPRYNNEEQVYSNLRQLLGRGGRVGQNTDIILQTYAIKNPIIRSLSEQNYKEFFIAQLRERKVFGYPPYAELAYISYKHKDKHSSLSFLQKIYKDLCRQKQNNVEITLVDTSIKRNNQYFSKIILKGQKIREFIEPLRKEILSNGDLSISFEY